MDFLDPVVGMLESGQFTVVPGALFAALLAFSLLDGLRGRRTRRRDGKNTRRPA